MQTAREHQLDALRTAAKELRELVEKSRKEAASWQEQANKARELADRNEKSARIWEVLADALDGGQLDDIVVPLGTGRDEPTNTRIHALQGRLMAQLPEYELDAWSIQCRKLTAMLHRAHGGSRHAILNIADRLGIGYSEEDRGAQVHVAAEGEIDGIEVEIWSLLAAEETGARAVEHVDYEEAAAVREIEREMAIEAGDDSEIDAQIAEDDARFERAVWLAQQEAESEVAEDAESDDENRHTADQLNGNTCSVCNGAFRLGEASQPSGYVLDHGQLFAHTACLDESEAV